MCVVNTIFSIASAVIQGAFSIYKTTEIIKYQQAQAEENIKTAKENAEMLRQNAALERQESLEEARKERLKTLQSMASEKALIASGNIDVNSQTSLDKLESISTAGELNALNITDKGEARAQKYLLGAQKYDKQADLILQDAKKSTKDKALMLLGSGIKSYKSIYNSIGDSYDF